MMGKAPRTKVSNRSDEGPCYGELVTVIVAGLLHVILEVAFSEAVSAIFNGVVVLVGLGYVLWRVGQSGAVRRRWGMRRDNFASAFGAHLGFAAIGGMALFAIGLVRGSMNLPETFWLTLALYPLWGLAQQFALQNLIALNLTGLMSRPVPLATGAAALFAGAHFPFLELAVLAFAAGFVFTLIYRRFPNLWAVAIVHGILGSLAAYLVLGRDPGAKVLELLT